MMVGDEIINDAARAFVDAIADPSETYVDADHGFHQVLIQGGSIDVAAGMRAAARVIAPGLEHAVFLARLLVAGWQVSRVSLYDEEGLEGWEWSNHDYSSFPTYQEIGCWHELPPIPEALIEELRREMGAR